MAYQAFLMQTISSLFAKFWLCYNQTNLELNQIKDALVVRRLIKREATVQTTGQTPKRYYEKKYFFGDCL